MRYDAFISYSHAADDRLAPALQRGLERLARRWYRPRALAVFRDETGLAVSPHMWASIVRALDDSEWFIVLCSPEAAASAWVDREIRHWLAHKARDRILLVLTDGDLVWDHDRGDYDTAASTALPPALLNQFGDQPRHLDLRWARSEEQLDLRHARFRPSVGEIAAPIHNIARDELETEDVRQHRRTVRLARGATSVLVLLVIVSLSLGVIAAQQRTRANREANVAQDATNSVRAAALAAQAINAEHDHSNDLALLLAVEANRLGPSPATRRSLLSALIDQPGLVRQLHGLHEVTEQLVFSPDGQLLAATTVSGQVTLWNLRTGQPLPHQPARRGNSHGLLAFADNGRILVASPSPGVTDVFDVASGLRLRSFQGAVIATASAAPVAAMIVFHDGRGTAVVVDLRNGQALGHFDRVNRGPLALSSDGTVIAWTVGDFIRAWKVDGRPSGRGCFGRQPDGYITNADAGDPEMAFTADGTKVRTVGLSYRDRVEVLCDLASGRATTTSLSLNSADVTVIAESPDNRILVGRRDDDRGDVRLFDAETHKEIAGPLPSVVADRSRHEQVVFSADSRLVTATETDGAVHVWATDQLVPPIARVTSLDTRYLSVELDREGNVGVAQNVDGSTVTILDMEHGRVIGHITKATHPVISDDGTIVAAIGTRRLVVFDVRKTTTKEISLASIRPHSTPCNFVLAVTSTPPTVAFGCVAGSFPRPAGYVRLLHLTDAGIRPDRLVPVWGNGFDRLTFSPNGRVMVASRSLSSFSSLQIFDLEGGELRRGRTVLGASEQDRPTFTPDSNYLVTSDVHVSLLSLDQRPTRTVLVGVPVGVPTVSPDGSLVVSNNTDTGTITLWDLRTATLVGTLSALKASGQSSSSIGSVESVAVARNNRSLIVMTGAAVIRWSLDPADWVREACTIANRNLTRAEWAQYLGSSPYRKTCPNLLNTSTPPAPTTTPTTTTTSTTTTKPAAAIAGDGTWRSPQLTITPNSLGAVRIGMTLDEAQIAAGGLIFDGMGDGFAYPTALPTGYPHDYVGATGRPETVTCVGAGIGQGGAHQSQSIVTPEGFQLGDTVQHLLAVYGNRARYIPAPKSGMTTYAGYVVTTPNGSLTFAVGKRASAGARATIVEIAGFPSAYGWQQGMTGPNSCTG